MKWQLTLIAALKGLLYVMVGGLLVGLTSPEWTAGLDNLADAIASAIPVFGGLFAGTIKGLLYAGAAALVAWLNNVRKHWSPTPAAKK